MNDQFRGEGLYKDTKLEIKGLYTNSEFFEVFDFLLQDGSAPGILDEPYSLILSSETADKFFGDSDPIGKFIEIDTIAYEVKGVLAKTKKKSHIQFEALTSLSTLVFALVTGLLSGALPAVVISALKPISVLKGITNVKFFSRLTLRKILLVSQFVFSMVFIISILLIFKQMNFMVNVDLGFDSEVVYDIDLQGKDFSKVKDEYSQLPEVISICASSHVPAEGNMWGVNVRLKMDDEKYEANYFSADEHFIETMGLDLIAGRNFPENMSGENENFVIVSEMTLEHFQLGSAGEALGITLILSMKSMEIFSMAELNITIPSSRISCIPLVSQPCWPL